MSTVISRRREPSLNGVPLLANGDRLKQPEFHRRYEAYPEDVKIELVGGIVYMASPLGLDHSDYDDEIGFLLGLYRRATPGVQVLHNATTILGEESEPQPDLGIRVRPEYGGQSGTNAGNYVEGAPELLVEVAHSTRALAFHGKRDDYRRAGVVEYLILAVEQRRLDWHHFPSGTTIAPNRAGVSRSRAFPGLWLHVEALLGLDSTRLRAVAEAVLASRAHATFARRLGAARRLRAPPPGGR
jgi:Uma2 family endonuclease